MNLNNINQNKYINKSDNPFNKFYLAEGVASIYYFNASIPSSLQI